MSCNTSVDYKTYLFHKEKIINMVYEENSQVVFREKFNQMLQKIKNKDTREWIQGKIIEIIGSKAYVYDKMSIIEALNSIEKSCYGKTSKENTPQYENAANSVDSGSVNQEGGINDDEEDEEDEEDSGDEDEDDEDESEGIEGFLQGLFDNVEGFGNRKKKRRKRKRKKKKKIFAHQEDLYKTWKNKCYTQQDGGKKKIVNVSNISNNLSCSQVESILAEQSEMHRDLLCNHCSSKSGYFASGNTYTSDSRNVNSKGDDKYNCDKCELPNDYLLKPIKETGYIERFVEVFLHVISFFIIVVYSLIFTNISYRKNSKEGKKEDDNTEIMSLNSIIRMLSYIIDSLKMELLKAETSKNPSEIFQSHIQKIMYMIPTFGVIALAFVFGFYEGNMNYTTGHMYALFMLVALVVFKAFIIGFEGIIRNGPKIIPLLRELKSWCWIYFTIMIFFGIYVLFSAIAELGNMENTDSFGLTKFVLVVNKFFSKFMNALLDPLRSLVNIIKDVKFNFYSIMSTFFMLTLSLTVLFIPVILFLSIIFSVISLFDVFVTYDSIKTFLLNKQALLYFIFAVSVIAILYGALWYYMSIYTHYRPGMSPFTLSMIQYIFTILGVLPFVVLYIKKDDVPK